MDIDCIDTTDFSIIEEEIPDFGDEEVEGKTHSGSMDLAI